ncbi:unnamed protein product, partial [marine sediment metagenome]
RSAAAGRLCFTRLAWLGAAEWGYGCICLRPGESPSYRTAGIATLAAAQQTSKKRSPAGGEAGKKGDLCTWGELKQFRYYQIVSINVRVFSPIYININWVIILYNR